jgi:hypothetical protein
MEVVIWNIILWVFKFPGALVLHALSGFKRPVDYFLNHKKPYGVSLIGLAVVILVGFIFSC